MKEGKWKKEIKEKLYNNKNEWVYLLVRNR